MEITFLWCYFLGSRPFQEVLANIQHTAIHNIGSRLASEPRPPGMEVECHSASPLYSPFIPLGYWKKNKVQGKGLLS